MVRGLKPDEVAVWWMEFGALPAAVISRWRACLDPAELARADRFHFGEDRLTYTAAHWLVRTALASVAGLPPAEWRFVVEKQGKPAIDPALCRPELRFNLSHTRGFVACAVSVSSEIGIDVEALTRTPAGLDIAERFFSPSEVAILRGKAQDQRLDTFLRFWTLKEAFIKATGEGLPRADSFSFSLDPIAISYLHAGADEPAGLTFIERRLTPRHLPARDPASSGRPVSRGSRRDMPAARERASFENSCTRIDPDATRMSNIACGRAIVPTPKGGQAFKMRNILEFQFDFVTRKRSIVRVGNQDCLSLNIQLINAEISKPQSVDPAQRDQRSMPRRSGRRKLFESRVRKTLGPPAISTSPSHQNGRFPALANGSSARLRFLISPITGRSLDPVQVHISAEVCNRSGETCSAAGSPC